MAHLRLAHICRRRMIRNLAFDRHGCVVIVEGAPDETMEELLRSILRNLMVCRKVLVARIPCSWLIYVWHTHVDDD